MVSSMLMSVCAGAGMDSLRARLRGRFPNIGSRTPYVTPGFSNGGATSAASAAANGGYGGSGSAAAASAAAASGGNRYAARPYDAYPEDAIEDVYEPVVTAPRYAARPSHYLRPPPPVKPNINYDTFRRNNVAYHNPARYAHHYPTRGGGSAAAAAAASAASGSDGLGGSASSAAAAAAATGGSGYTTGGETAAATGTYANTDLGKESSSYRRSTENLLNHENGHVDDNHYYNAQSYGKTDDENLHEAYNKDDEDIEQTRHLFRRKKSGENYVLDYNKASRESGSGVLAKDKHSSAFNKNSRKLVENVHQKHKIRGNGVVEDVNHVTSHDLDDDDEEIFDSDGLEGPHVGHVGHGGSSSAAAAASAAADGSVASSAGGAAVH